MSDHRRTRQIEVSQLPWNLVPEPAQQPPLARQPPLTAQYQAPANNFALSQQQQKQQLHRSQQLHQQQQQQQQQWQQQPQQTTDFARQQPRQSKPGLTFPVLPAHCQAPAGLRGPGANLAMHPAASQHRCNLAACLGGKSSSFSTPMPSSLALQSDPWLCVG